MPLDLGPLGPQHPDGEPPSFAGNGADWLSRLEAKAVAENPQLAPNTPAQDSATEASTAGQRKASTTSLSSPLPTDADPQPEGNQTIDESRAEQDHSDSDDSEDSDSDGSVVLIGENDSKIIKPQDIDPEAGTAVQEDVKPGDVATDAPKPKRKRKKSVSPPPLPQPKVQPTIRLELSLPLKPPKTGTFLNIRDKARGAGLINYETEGEQSDGAPEEPAVATAGAMSASTMSILGRKPGAATAKPKKRRKIQDRDEGYDKDDPFVDDSELNLDMVKFCGVPEREGFYVWSGELPLKKVGADKPRRAHRKKADASASDVPKDSTKKTAPKAKKASSAAPSVPPEEETIIHPNAPMQLIGSVARGPVDKRLVVGKAAKAGTKSNSTTPVGTPKASAAPAATPKKTVASNSSAAIAAAPVSPGAAPLVPLSEDIAQMFNAFSALAKKESFVPKHKFPEALKPPLFEMSLQAVHRGELDDNYFRTLMQVLPYNKFTLTKLVKREIYPTRQREITERQAELLQELKDGIAERMPESEQAYANAVAKWQVEHAKWVEENRGLAQSQPMDVDGEENGEIRASNSTEPPEPKRRFIWKEPLRGVLYEYLALDSEILRLANEKAELEKSTDKAPTEITARKKVYAHLVTYWPEGWMTSKDLSMQWSAARKKRG